MRSCQKNAWEMKSRTSECIMQTPHRGALPVRRQRLSLHHGGVLIIKWLKTQNKPWCVTFDTKSDSTLTGNMERLRLRSAIISLERKPDDVKLTSCHTEAVGTFKIRHQLQSFLVRYQPAYCYKTWMQNYETLKTESRYRTWSCWGPKTAAQRWD